MKNFDGPPLMPLPPEFRELAWDLEKVRSREFLEKYRSLTPRRIVSPTNEPLFEITPRDEHNPLAVEPFQQSPSHTLRNVTILPQHGTLMKPVVDVFVNIINANARHAPKRETLGQQLANVPNMVVRVDGAFVNTKNYPPDYQLTSEELRELDTSIHELDDQSAYGGVHRNFNPIAAAGRARFQSEMAEIGRPVRLAVFRDNYQLDDWGFYSFDDDHHTPRWDLDEPLDSVALQVRAKRAEKGSRDFMQRLDSANFNTSSDMRDCKATGAVDDPYLNLGMILADPEATEYALERIRKEGLPPPFGKGVYSARKERAYAGQTSGKKERGESSKSKMVYEFSHTYENGELVRMPVFLQQRVMPLTAANLGIRFADIDREELHNYFYRTPDGRDFIYGDKVFEHPPIPGNERYFYTAFRVEGLYMPLENMLSSEPVFTPTGGVIEMREDPYSIHGAQNSLKIICNFEGATVKDYNPIEPPRKRTLFHVTTDFPHKEKFTEAVQEEEFVNAEALNRSDWNDLLHLHPVTVMRRYAISRQLQECESNDYIGDHLYANPNVTEAVFGDIAQRHGARNRADDMEFLFQLLVKKYGLASERPLVLPLWQTVLQEFMEGNSYLAMEIDVSDTAVFKQWYEKKRSELESESGVPTTYLAPVRMFTNGHFRENITTWYSVDAIQKHFTDTMKEQLAREEQELIARLYQMPQQHPEEAIDLYRAFATNHYWGSREMIAPLLPQLAKVEPKIAAMLMARLLQDQRSEVCAIAQATVQKFPGVFPSLADEDISMESLREQFNKDIEPLPDKWVNINILPAVLKLAEDRYEGVPRLGIFPYDDLLFDDYVSHKSALISAEGPNYSQIRNRDSSDIDYARVDPYPRVHVLDDNTDGKNDKYVNLADVYRRLKASDYNPRAWFIRQGLLWHYDRAIPQAQTLIKALVPFLNEQLPFAEPLEMPIFLA